MSEELLRDRLQELDLWSGELDLWSELQELAKRARKARRAACKFSSLRAMVKATNRCPWLMTKVSKNDIKSWLCDDPSTLKLPTVQKQIFALICVLSDWADELLDSELWLGRIGLAQLKETGTLEELLKLHSQIIGDDPISPPSREREGQRPSESALPEWKAGAAVLVGVHRYEYLKNVPSIKNNVLAIRALLTSPKFGIPFDRCFTVENPTDPRLVFEALDTAFSSGAESLFFYYAGHGLAHPTTGRLLLSVSDSRKHAYYSYLEFDRLREHIADCGISRRLVILDSCYSGAGLDSLSPLAEGVTAIKGSYVLASSAATEQSLAPEGQEFTTFTGELLETLEDGTPDVGPILSAESVFKSVRQRCKDQGFPAPSRQVRDGGDMIMLMENPYWKKISELKSSLSSVEEEARKSLFELLERWVHDLGDLAASTQSFVGEDEESAARREELKRRRQAWTVMKEYKSPDNEEAQRKRKWVLRAEGIGVIVFSAIAVCLAPFCLLYDEWALYGRILGDTAFLAVSSVLSFHVHRWAKRRGYKRGFIRGMEERWKVDRKL
ncbi:caspase domain-containing protein [Streptomyces lydicus]|uniref:caspase domain-containing protein n=1 Tax=Streptomyces lydicus TaxID=47763 RepID=UPI00378CCBC6